MREDDRTPKQMKTHTALITATDRMLSGWGGAKNGLSKCAWACRPQHLDKVYRWVQDRTDLKHVNVNLSGRWYPKAAHVHIYAVEEGHPALN